MTAGGQPRDANTRLTRGEYVSKPSLLILSHRRIRASAMLDVPADSH